MQFGFEHFCKQCTECGVDGMIIPDLPFKDYQEHYRIIADGTTCASLCLLLPKQAKRECGKLMSNTDGFIYMVSSASTTGAQQDFDVQKRNYFKRIEEMKLRNPRMVGFGISNKATFKAACEHASGAIIGSRFVTLLEEEKDPQQAITSLLNGLKE
jgi:tryptophan synthase alpha chain